MYKRLGRSLIFCTIGCVLTLTALVGATFAWFSFTPTTNITPMHGSVSTGGVSLLIANTRDGNFAEKCDLILDDRLENLRPVTTGNLRNFYTTYYQRVVGSPSKYTDISESVYSNIIHGSIYMTSVDDACDVYFHPTMCSMVSDNQLLSALRLGFLIRNQEGESVKIFRLDEFLTGDVKLEAIQTTPENNTVVNSIDSDKNPSFITDTATLLEPFKARSNGGNNGDKYAAGENKLFSVLEDEIVELEFFVYLEGCDENCTNIVQDKELEMQLFFVGIPVKEAE